MVTTESTSKDIVEDLLRRLPEEVSLQQIAEQIQFIAAIRQGLSDLDRGEEIPIETIENEIHEWIIK